MVRIMRYLFSPGNARKEFEADLFRYLVFRGYAPVPETQRLGKVRNPACRLCEVAPFFHHRRNFTCLRTHVRICGGSAFASPTPFHLNRTRGVRANIFFFAREQQETAG